MLNYYNFDIVFAEVPDEVTLAINITGCPNNCPGCHSPHLQDNKGKPLNNDALLALIGSYTHNITCVCFMGGDADPQEVERLALFTRDKFPRLKTAWYSGKPTLSNKNTPSSFNYIKIGEYNAAYGPLNKPTTNQRFYRIDHDVPVDITARFWGGNLTLS